MNEENQTSHRQQRLGAAIAEYLDAIDSGQPFSLDHWLSSHDDLREQLNEFLQVHSKIGQLISSGPQSAAPLMYESTRSSHGSNDSLPEGTGATTFSVPGYELIEELGRGGMGVVYRARQDQPNREVALKVPTLSNLLDREDLRRFEREANSIAKLDHPSVIPIYSVGQTRQASPYLTMKLLSGGSLSQLGQVPPEKAASIIVQIADAVAHAHQRGLLHRDLKPSNVLFDENGKPVVTDFGLAKFVDANPESKDLTREGAFLGTPAYMAPEQMRGEATTLSDVYSLGAILYFLLTGQPPFKAASLPDLIQQVSKSDPKSIRSLAESVPLDLEVICFKCLRKEPDSRYDSADELSRDLKRWLSHEPILARAIKPHERFWLWCRRNPVPAVMSLALLCTLIIGTGLFVSQYTRTLAALAEVKQANSELEVLNAAETEARQEAERQAEQNQLINVFLQETLRSADPSFDGREVTIASRLDTALDELREQSGMDAEKRVALLSAIADAYLGLGLFPEGREACRIAVDSLDTQLAQSNLGFKVRMDLGWAALQNGDATSAVDTLSEVIADAKEILGEHTEVTDDGVNRLALALHAIGKTDDAYKMLLPVLEYQNLYLEGLTPIKLKTLGNMGMISLALGNFAEATNWLEQAVAGFSEEHGPKSPTTLVVRGNLAVCYLNQREMEKAEALVRSLYADQREVFGETHPQSLGSLNTLAGIYMTSGKVDQAVETLESLKESMAEALGPDHPNTITIGYNLAGGYLSLRDYALALEHFETSLDLMKNRFGAQHPKTLKCLHNIALCQEQLGQLESARENFDLAAASLRQANSPPLAEQLAVSLTASIRCRLKGRESANPDLQAKIEEARELWNQHKPDSWQSWECESLYGEFLALAQKTEQAEKVLLEAQSALEARRERISPQRRDLVLAESIRRLASFYNAMGNSDEAARWNDQIPVQEDAASE